LKNEEIEALKLEHLKAIKKARADLDRVVYDKDKLISTKNQELGNANAQHQ